MDIRTEFDVNEARGWVGLHERKVAVVVPLHFHVENMENVPATVAGTIDDDGDGNLVVTRLAFAAPPEGPYLDNREALRRIRLPKIVEAAVAMAAVPWDPDTGRVQLLSLAPRDTTADDARTLRRSFRARQPDAFMPSASEASDLHLKQVAAIYRSAPSKKRKAVMDEFDVSVGVANRYIAEARARGHLGPSRGMRLSGEIEPDPKASKGRRKQ